MLVCQNADREEVDAPYQKGDRASFAAFAARHVSKYTCHRHNKAANKENSVYHQQIFQPLIRSADRLNGQPNEKGVLSERINGSGCPACAGKTIVSVFNDLATTHPDLANEWHPNKNEDLLPTMVSKGTSKKVWWKCSKCGYEWPANIRKRVEGSGGKQCALKEKAKNQYKAVYQFTKEGTFVKRYDSARIAAKELGISRVTIQHVCNGQGQIRTAGGFCWSYKMDGNNNHF